MNGQTDKIEFGDFQTPEHFAGIVCKYLKNDMALNPTVIIEPTCGIGNFLVSSLQEFSPRLSYGIEINAEYINIAKERLDNKTILVNSDLFTFDFSKITDNLSEQDTVLVVGNPPWVNNSVLSALGSDNQPIKSNFKGMKGLDAITGSANFDICEYMILQIINAFEGTNTTIAMLCKTIVARNAFQELKRNNTDFCLAHMLTFDTKKVFDVNVDGCLFVIKLSTEKNNVDYCEVYNIEEPNVITSRFGYKDGKFYSSLDEDCKDFDGVCCFEWRQGVKHDCSKVMELDKKDNAYYNGYGTRLDIEDTLVFPLVKSSHFKTSIIKNFKKYVIVTQKKVKEDTTKIVDLAPKTWQYLNNNIEAFQARKSSIYKNSPEFSMFGIGDYSYAPYKVGISGFYKVPLFALLSADKPVMTDDTCYFLSFDTYDMAYTAMLILNSNMVQEFLKSIAFIDSKRPYTKKVLDRIDFTKIIEHTDLERLKETEVKLELKPYINQEHLRNFERFIVYGNIGL